MFERISKLSMMVIAGALLAQAAAAAPPPLALDGPPALPFLTAADFAAGKLRGFELGDTSHSKQPDGSYFTDLVATGANLGRVWIQLGRCKNCTEYKLDNAQVRNMDYFVSKARATGFWVVFTVTTHDERAGDLWQREELQRSLAAIWQSIADRYKDVPEVAGYDLLNEPIAKGQDGKSPNQLWFQLATDITSAIRSVDSKHVVIVEPSPGAEPYGFNNLEPIKDSNVVYSVHMYHPHEFTHQGTSKAYPKKNIEYPSRADSPIGAWDKARLSQDLEPVRKWAKRSGIPIYVGEFSAVRWAPSGSRERYIADLISLFEAEKWSWTYHQWRGWPGWDPENESDDSELLASKRNSSSSAMEVIRPYFKANQK